MDDDLKMDTNDNVESDVEIVNKYVPEVIVSSDSSFDCSNSRSDNSNEKAGNSLTANTNLTERDAELSCGDVEEDQLNDLIVIDDVDTVSPSSDVNLLKQEPQWSVDNTQNDVKQNFLLDLPNVKLEYANNKRGVDEQSTFQPSQLSLTHIKKDSSLSQDCPTIGQSLSKNENFDLQLESSHALDSYLDKTCNESSLDEKPKSIPESTNDVGDGVALSMKENYLSQTNVDEVKTNAETEKVCDALILTADEELETEMSLGEKNGKTHRQVNSEDKKPTGAEETFSAPEEKSDESVVLTLKDDTVDQSSIQQENKNEDCVNANKAIEKNKTLTVENLEDSKVAAGKKTLENASANTSKIVWVSNLIQSIKANELKQFVMKIGKVVTAKIVTDGKKCYGYVVMDASEDAAKCVKELDNSYFEGRKISLSLTRPLQSHTGDKEVSSKLTENEKTKSGNETDESKMRKSSDILKSSDGRKRRRSCSRSRRATNKVKRQSVSDPLTTKFTSRKGTSGEYRDKSRSSDRFDRKYLREKQERERLQRKLIEEQRRHRDEILRHIEREEKHREMEFKLEQERRKLQLERELFEKERRELARLDLERRKIEKERMEVLEQRSKLHDEIQKSRLKKKPDEFILSSVIGKPQQTIMKTYEKRKESPKRDNYDRKQPNSKYSFQKSNKDSREELKRSCNIKRSTSSSSQKTDFRAAKENSKGEKNYERSAPPPPKLTNDFDNRKTKHLDHKSDYSVGKSNYGERKLERGGRKIEVIDRKYYPETSNESSERKLERTFKFEDRKPHAFNERKAYDYSRDLKRYRDESYPERDNNERSQWPAAPINYNNDPWKVAGPGPISGSTGARYQESNFPSSSYGGPSRIPPFYYHPTPGGGGGGGGGQDYPRYDHCSQANGRKYT